MKVSLDTSIIVEIDRGVEETTSLLTHLIDSEHSVFLSAVVASEIYTGAYLRDDFRAAASKVRRLLLRFEFISLDAGIAETIGEINAYLISHGLPVEYQDVAIAATFISRKGDFLLTLNKKHFQIIPELKKKTVTPKELQKKI
ncbi:MAG: type II toxin-antitoxin system VapC family toxin [Candidatus Hodarchaeales archaeon]|jgi:predicted nucleic acid-binding protein